MMNNVSNFSFLLRIWRVRRNNELVWMASLEDPRTSKRRGFTSLEGLFAFLSQEVEQVSLQGESRTGNPNSTDGNQEEKQRDKG